MTIWSMLARTLGSAAVREAPRLLEAYKQGRDTEISRAPVRSAPVSPAPVGARTLDYSPEADGQADPGEVVWTWVPYEDDPAQGKDRPVLVVGRSAGGVLALMLSSQADRDGEQHWLALGPGAWDREQRPSWVRLDRVLTLAEDSIRREGSVLARDRFDTVASRLRASYGWS